MPERNDDGHPMCECACAEMLSHVDSSRYVVLSKHDSPYGMLAKIARRDCERCHGTGYAPELISVRRDAHEALVAALRAFVDYYDQAGIGECTEADEDSREDGFDGDETFNVRQARAALALVDGEEKR